MRTEPTLRIPLGILALFVALMVYGLLVARYIAPWIEGWAALAQTPVYIVLGVIWLLPLKRFMIWMETGRWR
jgi:L-lactate permease